MFFSIILTFYFFFKFFLCSISWKDYWIQQFAEKNVNCSVSVQISVVHRNEKQRNCIYCIRKYIPVRNAFIYNQSIPKVIWQTWASNFAAGRHHFKAMQSFIDFNPEYEYFNFNDTDASNFLNVFFPLVAVVYATILPGAMRADIWRLAIVYKYGGIYVDSDSFATVPFRSFIWPNASMVSGLGRANDFHQWALLYSKKHEVLQKAIEIAINRTLRLFWSKEVPERFAVVKTTAAALQMAATEVLRHKYDCLKWIAPERLKARRNETFADDLIGHCCYSSTQERAAHRCQLVMQIYMRDEIGGQIKFKSFTASREMSSAVTRYSLLENDWNAMFRNFSLQSNVTELPFFTF